MPRLSDSRFRIIGCCSDYIVFVCVTVWNTMCHMCTMPCLHILTGTMLLSRALPSELTHKSFRSLYIRKWFYHGLVYDSFVPIRFYKESSEEERDHAEKLMKYQVLNSHQEDYVVPLFSFFFFGFLYWSTYLIYYDFFRRTYAVEK